MTETTRRTIRDPFLDLDPKACRRCLGAGYMLSTGKGCEACDATGHRPMSETTTKEPPDELVWRVCLYLRDASMKCKQCPEYIDMGHHGQGSPGCYLLAREVINIVQTGNPWRRPQ